MLIVKEDAIVSSYSLLLLKVINKTHVPELCHDCLYTHVTCVAGISCCSQTSSMCLDADVMTKTSAAPC